MKRMFALLASAVALSVAAQTGSNGTDSFSSLKFLEGTWAAQAKGNPGVAASGTYTFREELGNHVLVRHSNSQHCKGPEDFDCGHQDVLYIYQDGESQPLKAIYFDSEGHVIHYQVSTPTVTSAEFLSDSSQPGPQFRLLYELQGNTMFGKFRMRMPGQNDWKSYLEWSGTKTGDKNPGAQVQ